MAFEICLILSPCLMSIFMTRLILWSYLFKVTFLLPRPHHQTIFIYSCLNVIGTLALAVYRICHLSKDSFSKYICFIHSLVFAKELQNFFWFAFNFLFQLLLSSRIEVGPISQGQINDTEFSDPLATLEFCRASKHSRFLLKTFWFSYILFVIIALLYCLNANKSFLESIA